MVENKECSNWSEKLKVICQKENIPFILINNNEVQLGYGINSKRIYKDDILKRGLKEEGLINEMKKKNNGLIPIIAVTGTNGKTTTVRLINELLIALGYNTGMSSTGGIYINKKVIRYGDTTGFYSAQEVLKSNDVDIAILETARGGIVKNGIGFQGAKVAIITSLSEDHIGMRGIKNIYDLAEIKSKIVDGLAQNGVLIIRATDILYDKFKEKKKLIVFDYNMNTNIEKHILNGGKAYYIKNDFIVEHNSRNNIEKLININNIPFTFNGISKSNTLNIICAIVAIKELVNRNKELLDKIKNIQCNIYTNLGRQNIINFNNFKMIIDYGHNREAFEEVFSIAKSLKHSKITGIITAPGDRMDRYIVELGEIAACYCDKIIIKEQPDLRGRKIGETAQLLKEGVLNKKFNISNLLVCLEEKDAILEALNNAQEGEIIVSFSQFLYLTFPVINQYRIENGMELIGEDLDLTH